MQRVGSVLRTWGIVLALGSLSSPAQLLAQCEIQKLTAFDADQAAFGVGVSVSDDVAVVGAWGDKCDTGGYCGSAYVYRFSPGTPGGWIHEQKLAAPDAADGDAYGLAVSVDGDLTVVGARGVDCAVGTDCGAAYIYRFNGSIWVEEQKLIASDASAGAFFGQSVSVSSDVVVVGAPWRDCGAGPDCGTAYVYRFDGSTWVEEQKLTASDTTENALFGFSLFASLDVVLVGSFLRDCAAGPRCGAAYVYRFDGTTWVEEQKLTASDANSIDDFGFSVSTESGLAVIGAYGDDCAAGLNCGAAYVFRFNGSTWVEEQKLTASDAGSIALFGDSVAMHNGVVLVGAGWDDCAAGVNCGSAYVFRFNGSTWIEQQKLTASDAGSLDYFGSSVSIYSNVAFVGAGGVDCADGSDYCGAAYVFDLGPGCTGACCDLRTGVCSDGVSGTECLSTYEIWTKGATCNQVGCEAVTGACCNHSPVRVCTDEIAFAQCDCATCEWFMLAACSSQDCDGGACCDGRTGQCFNDLSENQCTGDDLSWSRGTPCIELQPQCTGHLGACCDHNPFGACVDAVTSDACNCPTCEWFELAECSSVDCGHTSIPTVNTWGLAVLTLLLLAGAKLAFGRPLRVDEKSANS